MKHYIYIDKEILNSYISQIYGKILDKEKIEKVNVKSILPEIISGNIELEYAIKEKSATKLLGENLGNQKFVNELISKQDRNAIQKVYDWVVDKVESLKNKITGDTEAEYWRKVKKNFENALSKQYQGNNNVSIKNSIQTDTNGNKYVKVDTNQDIFEGKSIKEQTKIAQEYILNNFRENGLLKDNNNINVSRKTANEYVHPKKGLDNKTYSSKLKASTELDNLLEISQFIKSEPDDGRHVFAKDGWDYYETVFKVGNKTYSGLLNIANGKNGKLLYDITNIKERASNYSVKTVSVANSSYNNSILPTKDFVNRNTNKYSMQESENNSDSINLLKNRKQKQLELIKKYNPMQDDYHTGIRNIDDIKTLKETLKDNDWADYDEFNPDYTRKMADEAIKSGKITVYSSYPIDQDVFISPSYMESESYSEDGKVYSKEVNINDIAWIDPTQGQYAKVDNTKYSQNNTFDDFVRRNSVNKGTGETI